MTNMMVVSLFLGLGLFFTLAYLSERERPLRWLVYLVVVTVNAAALAIGVPYALMGLLANVTGPIADTIEGAGLGLSGDSASAVAARMPLLGVVSLVVGLVGFVLLVPAVRRIIARALPIDPDRSVHTVALQLATHLVGVSAAVALLLPVMLLDESMLESTAITMTESGLGVLWAQSVGFVLLSLLGVGLIVHRDWRETLDRLGLTLSFNWKWWVVGSLAALAVGVAVDQLWSMLDSQGLQEVERLSEALFAPYLEYGLLGALTIGLSAGIGEEILFRGAVQPRLGLIFTSLLFAVVHTQYTVSLALLQIFAVGLILGLTRRNTNTTTAIATHSTYNLVLALIAIYAPELAP